MKKEKVELGLAYENQIRGIKDTTELLNGKWKILIISHLYYNGSLRFMDLKRQLESVSSKVLSKELKDLEMNKLLKRTVIDTTPIAVEYELTGSGKRLYPVVRAMAKWGMAYRDEIRAEDSSFGNCIKAHCP